MKTPTQERWYTGITRYQWIVLVIALVGWMFDIFEGQIFVASMREAMPSLIGASGMEHAAFYNNVALAAFLLGGALGGVFFGMISDRVGRKKTMAYSILFYSFFTWISAFSQAWWHLVALRFLVAIGVGGQWAIASAFVTEVFPSKARAHAASIFHASGTFGTFLAAGVGAFLLGNAAVATWCETTPLLHWTHTLFDPTSLPWRLGFALGLVPAVLVFFIFRWLREPESWQAAKERSSKDETQKAGVLSDLFKGPALRSTLVGVSLAAIGLATFWGVHIYGKDTMYLAAEKPMLKETELFKNSETITPEILKEARKTLTPVQQSELKRWEMSGMFLLTFGLLFGQLYFGPLSQKIGRKSTFIVFHIAAFVISIIVFQFATSISMLVVLLPVFGFFTAGMHAGYAVYFPELYPTRMRGTGTGFCFNMGRLLATPVLLLTGWLQTYGGFTLMQSTTLLSFLFLLGPVAIYFARETKGQELLE